MASQSSGLSGRHPLQGSSDGNHPPNPDHDDQASQTSVLQDVFSSAVERLSSNAIEMRPRAPSTPATASSATLDHEFSSSSEEVRSERRNGYTRFSDLHDRLDRDWREAELVAEAGRQRSADVDAEREDAEEHLVMVCAKQSRIHLQTAHEERIAAHKKSKLDEANDKASHATLSRRESIDKFDSTQSLIVSFQLTAEWTQTKMRCPFLTTKTIKAQYRWQSLSMGPTIKQSPSNFEHQTLSHSVKSPILE